MAGTVAAQGAAGAGALAASGGIVVVDYHKGNLSSVARGLVRAGAGADGVSITDEPERIRAAAGIVLPGVGSFYDAVTYMAQSGQARAVREAVGRGVPFLGICLGLQLLYDRGDEDVPLDVAAQGGDDASGAGLEPGTVFEAEGRRWVRGLGVLRGSCTKLESSRLKVPHVGWDQVHLTAPGRSCPLLEGFPVGANMYFTHSYAVAGDAEDACVAARTFYARSFPCVAWSGNVYGCQFHPEKSSGRGLDILRNFVRVVGAAGSGAATAGAAAADGAGTTVAGAAAGTSRPDETEPEVIA